MVDDKLLSPLVYSSEQVRANLSIHFKLDCKIVLDRGHDTGDELEEEEEAILDARLAAIALNLVDHFLHYSRMVTRVDAQLAARQLRVRLERHCLLRVVSHDILEHLRLRQQRAVLRVPLQP